MNWRPSGPAFGITLRGMLVITALLAVVVSLVGVKVQHARVEQGIAREVVNSGGSVQRQNYGMDISTSADRTWFERWLDLDLESHVVRVSLGQNATSELLAKMAELRGLRQLAFPNHVATGPALSALTGLPELTSIDGWGSTVEAWPDDGIFAVASLPLLADLRIETPGYVSHGEIHSNWSADALAKIGQMPSLRSLFLRGLGVSDETLRDLHGPRRLESLSLSNARITDDCLTLIATDMTELQHLSIDTCFIKGAGLAALRRCPNLVSIVVRGCDLTDEGIADIGELKQIRSLRIDGGSKLTDEGLRRIGALAQLTDLTVVGECFTDQGLKYLSEFRELQTLHLQSRRGGFSDPAPLAENRKLAWLHLSPSLIPAKTVMQLKETIRNVVVEPAR